MTLRTSSLATTTNHHQNGTSSNWGHDSCYYWWFDFCNETTAARDCCLNEDKFLNNRQPTVAPQAITEDNEGVFGNNEFFKKKN